MRLFDTEIAQGKVEIVLAFFLLCFTIFLPIWSYYFLLKHKEDVQSEEFKMKYDSLYQNVDYHNT